MIAAVSPFTVGPAGDFTEIDFEQYKTWAEGELEIDNPGLSEPKYDEAHANLICDIFVSSKGERDLKSEKIGDYSYMKSTEGGGGKSSYRLRYEEIIKQYSIKPATTGVTRIDAEIPPQFKFDNQPARAFGNDD